MKKEYAFRTFPYTNKDGSIDWICEYPDLPGCTGVGDTPEEAVRSGEESKDLWLDVYFEDNGNYPESSNTYGKEFSGKFPIRTTSSLHRELSILAEAEGVSLNALCCNILSEAIGGRKAQPVFNITMTLPHEEESKEEKNVSWSDKQHCGKTILLPTA